jgi:hypothetical protein
MNDNFKPGDLVTGREMDQAIASIRDSIIARPAGSEYWTLQLPRCSIMTVAEAAEISHHDLYRIITVLHDGMLLEIFLYDIQHLSGTEQ